MSTEIKIDYKLYQIEQDGTPPQQILHFSTPYEAKQDWYMEAQSEGQRLPLNYIEIDNKFFYAGVLKPGQPSVTLICIENASSSPHPYSEYTITTEEIDELYRNLDISVTHPDLAKQ